MKNKKREKRLSLKKITISNLSKLELDKVHGGYNKYYLPGSEVHSCNENPTGND